MRACSSSPPPPPPPPPPATAFGARPPPLPGRCGMRACSGSARRRRPFARWATRRRPRHWRRRTPCPVCRAMRAQTQSPSAFPPRPGARGIRWWSRAAPAGGGGGGVGLVTDAAQLPAALASARSEALAGFGCGDLLIERALLHPRHLEVQVFADAHGACIPLGERDCSVQRRHQKLIEESPSPAVDAALRERLGACAVALARAAGYVGAGTVEFSLEEGQFFLLEM